MNYIRHLTGFFDRVFHDGLLNPSHIALYIALFQFWNLNRFRNPISISRDEVMRISKISSKATYHKCLKHLHAQGYIRYEPSYNPYRGSHVHLINFSDDLKPYSKKDARASSKFVPDAERVVYKQQAAPDTGCEQAVVPSINETNKSNNQNVGKGKDFPSSIPDRPAIEFHSEKEEKLREKKKDIPNLENILSFFATENYSSVEAHKFFNYYQSNGWLVGGKTKMTDWQAAARNWMLNIPKYETNDTITKSRPFDASAGKNYSEPL